VYRKFSQVASFQIRHYLILGGILLVGGLLRFWQLDSKPLWLDEVLTALFTLGRNTAVIPQNQFFPLSVLDQVFSLQSGLNCTQISQTVATESVHPPLFFCLMHQWLNWLQPGPTEWVWAIRALPALLGVGAIGAIYLLNRVAFSATAGLVAAACMAVSPFAVYLSQEARHYTLPLLLITLALTGLVQIQQDLSAHQLRSWVWLGWIAVNSISLYVHYFAILALVAQVTALTGWMVWQRQRIRGYDWAITSLALLGIGLTYLPWLPTLMSHFDRPETDWLIPYKPDWLDRVAPLYQTLVGWVLMVIALPVENQPQFVTLVATGLMLAFMVWLMGYLYRLCRLTQWVWQQSKIHPPLVLLASFTLCVILEFFAIVYILDKDITVVPRYNFAYYPGVCALLGVVLALPISKSFHPGSQKVNLQRGLMAIAAVVAAGLISSSLVVNGFVFQKSYSPDQVAQNMALERSQPLAVVVSYRSLQEIALGLSFAFELKKQYPLSPAAAPTQFAFFDHSAGYPQVWQKLTQIPTPLAPPLNLWIVASPGMRTKDYPRRFEFAPSAIDAPGKTICRVDPAQFHRVGFPYQLFRCRARKR
jgi:uncharacterized membrane protein